MDGQDEQATERLQIGSDEAGSRLDRAVADWRGLSRSAVMRLIDAAALRCNGRTLVSKDKGLMLQAGDVIELDRQYVSGEKIKPDPALKLDVLARGDGWLAISKPAGVPVRPHTLDEVGTVLNAVAAMHPVVNGVGEGGLRSGVVHRLDNDTSGVLLVATEQSAWQDLRDRFASHEIRKQYLAILHGSPPESGELTLPLRVAQHSPSRVEVTDRKASTDARDCSLAWQVTERFAHTASLVEVDLHTGFLHQVRVMMAHLGCPVIGDSLYGKPSNQAHAARHMLHACQLAFDDEQIVAPLPDDMRSMIVRLSEGNLYQ